MPFGSYTADAEFKVTNRPSINVDQILFIPETQKFVRGRLTTAGGAVNIEAATTYVMNTAFQAITVIFNGTSYEIY